MTCAHVVVGDNFTCNINGRKYKVTGSSSILDCNSRNVIYLIHVKNVAYSMLVKPVKHCVVE